MSHKRILGMYLNCPVIFSLNYSTISSFCVCVHYRHEHAPTNATTFDQKRLKNNLLRRTVDYNASVLKYLQVRVIGF